MCAGRLTESAVPTMIPANADAFATIRELLRERVVEEIKGCRRGDAVTAPGGGAAVYVSPAVAGTAAGSQTMIQSKYGPLSPRSAGHFGSIPVGGRIVP